MIDFIALTQIGVLWIRQVFNFGICIKATFYVLGQMKKSLEESKKENGSVSGSKKKSSWMSGWLLSKLYFSGMSCCWFWSPGLLLLLYKHASPSSCSLYASWGQKSSNRCHWFTDTGPFLCHQTTLLSQRVAHKLEVPSSEEVKRGEM